MPPASAAATGNLRGTVAGPTGFNAMNTRALFHAATVVDATLDPEVDSGFMEPDGRYKVSGLNGGNYKVRFGDFKGYYATEFYNDVATNVDVLVSHEALPVPPPPAPVVTHVAVSRGARLVGPPRAGEKVRATIGTVTPAGATVRYAWLLDGRRIKKATQRSLRIKPAMVGHRLSAKVIVTAPGLQRWTDVTASTAVRPAR